jgi:hypothetical protein
MENPVQIINTLIDKLAIESLILLIICKSKYTILNWWIFIFISHLPTCQDYYNAISIVQYDLFLTALILFLVTLSDRSLVQYFQYWKYL